MLRLSRAVVLAAAFGLTGCGDGLYRQAVSGSVSFQGTPVKSGSVVFVPIDASVKTTGGSAVRDGRYAISQELGLSPGKYRVSFTAMDKEVFGPAIPGDSMPAAKDMPKDLLPAKYAAASTLEADVTRGGDNVFNYELK